MINTTPRKSRRHTKTGSTQKPHKPISLKSCQHAFRIEVEFSRKRTSSTFFFFDTGYKLATGWSIKDDISFRCHVLILKCVREKNNNVSWTKYLDIFISVIISTLPMIVPVWRLDRRWTSGRRGKIVRKRRARAHVQMNPTSDLYKPLI